MTHKELWTKVGMMFEKFHETKNGVEVDWCGLCAVADDLLYDDLTIFYNGDPTMLLYSFPDEETDDFWFPEWGDDGVKNAERRAIIAYLFAAMTQAEFEDMLGATYKEHDIPITKEQ